MHKNVLADRNFLPRPISVLERTVICYKTIGKLASYFEVFSSIAFYSLANLKTAN